MLDIKDRFLNIPHLMPQEINRNHRDSISHRVIVFKHVIRIGILSTKVLPEA